MAMRNPPDLTKTIGSCGRFQVALTVSVHAATVISVWGILFMAFGSYNPGWMCLDDLYSNTSSAYIDGNDSHILDVALPSRSTFGDNSSRGMWDWVSFSSASALAGNASESTGRWVTDCAVRDKCQHLVYNRDSSSVVTEWELYCGNEWIPSTIISIEMSGVLIGSYISGQIGDKFGRKVSLYGSAGFIAVSNLLAIFSPSWEMYAAMLFLVGVSTGGILTCTFPYPLEFVTEKWRGLIAGLPIWNVGASTFALAALVLKDWRHIHITTAVVSSLVFLTVFWTPESVRWLAVHGKVDRAKRVVAQISRMNSRPCPDTRIIDVIAFEEMRQMSGHKYTYLDLFRLKAIRGYSIKLGFIWIVMAITYYAISFGIRSLSGNFYLNLLIFSFFELPGMIFVPPMLNKLGRQKATLIFFGLVAICAFSLVIVSFTTSGHKREMCILVLALSCKAIMVCAWAAVCVLSSELYPTVVRSLHYGYINSVARIGAMVSPFLIPNDPNNFYVVFIIIGVLVFVVCCITWTLPETKGRTLPDIASPNNQELNAMTMQVDI